MDSRRMYMIISVLCGIGGVMSWPSGAPVEVCTSMTPGHGTQSEDTNPYSISVSAVEYIQGGALTVTINGRNYMGILLQARVKDTDTIVHGTFSNFASGTRALSCPGGTDNAATHMNTGAKNSDTIYTWTAPYDLTDEIEFVATVNEGKSIWWQDIKSASLTKGTGTPPPTTTTAEPTTTTTDPVGSGCESKSVIFWVHTGVLLIMVLLSLLV